MARDKLPPRTNPKRATVRRIVDAVLRKDDTGKLPSVSYLARTVGTDPRTLRNWLKVDYSDLYADEWATSNEIVEAYAAKMAANDRPIKGLPFSLPTSPDDDECPW